MSGYKQVSFTYHGNLPAKSNFRRSGKDWRRRWGRIKEAEAELGWLAKSAGARLAPPGTPVRVTYTAYGQRQDTNNIAKLLLDSLIGVCYEDDRYVESVARTGTGGKQRVEVSVEYEHG